jgi:uncharacterized membrane protein YfcA
VLAWPPLLEPIYALVPIVAFAFMVETAVGFGGMVITLALGTLFLPIDVILPRVVPLNVGLSIVLALRHGRHGARRHLVRRILPFVLLGMPFGLLAFERLDRGVLTIVFGAFVLVLSLVELLRKETPGETRAALGGPVRALCLLAAGFMQGAFSTGGPMLVYVTARELPQKVRFRSTLVLAWVVLGCVLLATYIATGRTNATTLGDSLTLSLSMIVGLALGEHIHARIDEHVFKRVVYGMLTLASVLILARSLSTTR